MWGVIHVAPGETFCHKMFLYGATQASAAPEIRQGAILEQLTGTLIINNAVWIAADSRPSVLWPRGTGAVPLRPPSQVPGGPQRPLKKNLRAVRSCVTASVQCYYELTGLLKCHQIDGDS